MDVIMNWGRAAERGAAAAGEPPVPDPNCAVQCSAAAMLVAQAAERDGVEDVAFAAARRGHLAANAGALVAPRRGRGGRRAGRGRRGGGARGHVLRTLPTGTFAGEAAALTGIGVGVLKQPTQTFTGELRHGEIWAGLLERDDGRSVALVTSRDGAYQRGTAALTDGSMYRGGLRHGLRHGLGRQVSGDERTQHTGRWEHDVLRGPGAERVDGSVSFGTFTATGFAGTYAATTSVQSR